MRIRYQQLPYWSTIAYDVLLNGFSRSVHVVGYAKSGTCWLSGLMSESTGLPLYKPWKHPAPKLRPHVFHMMRLLPFDRVRNRTVYVMRDGRDAMVSRFYDILHREPLQRVHAEKFLGCEMTNDNLRELLPRFIEFLSTYQAGCADYKTHLTHWLQHDYVTVRYEDLLEDTAGQLRRIVQELGREPDPARIETAVRKYDFESNSKRNRGQEDKNSFLRKGVAGDWKNHFTPEAARVFDAYAGELLVDLGYEPDRSWVQDVVGGAAPDAAAEPRPAPRRPRLRAPAEPDPVASLSGS